jgi:serine/threonine protein kinase/tetratricopeptide (TPR) repeat protein
VRQIGAGGMGVVYEAHDQERNLRVAIKTLHQADSYLLYFLKQEFRLLADITHPNLVALHELISDGDAWFLVMELIDGVDLIQYVRTGSGTDRGAASSPTRIETMLAPTAYFASMESRAAKGAAEPELPPLSDPSQFERLRAAVLQIAAGIAALHRAGRLHRDIKPGNVMIESNGRAVLLDFGLAAEVKNSSPGSALDSGTAGTFVYMSPEQGLGEKLGEPSDWYSLGVMIYETIAGRLPFSGNRSQVQSARSSRDPEPVGASAPGTPADLAAVCTGLLHLRAEQRIGARELIRLLKGDAGTAAAIQSLKFVGRERQLRDLKNAFAAVKEGRTVAAYVRGPSGMGKSELVNHFLRELEQSNAALILRGRCYEREEVPFKAVDSLMDALARHLGRLPVEDLRSYLAPNVGALARIFPVLDLIVAGCGLTMPVAMDSQELRQLAFVGLRETMRWLGSRFTLVLYVDDLQWGDADSAALLTELLRQPNAPPLLLLGSYRSEYEDSPCLRALLAEGAARTAETRTIDIATLDQAEARLLALSVLTNEGASQELAERIAQEADGHPYLIAELASTAQGAPAGAGEPAGLSLNAVLWSRVAELPEKSRQLLRFVSVCGRPLRQDDAYAAAGYSERDPIVVGFLRSSRLTRGSGPGDQDVIEPYHDRVRETVVEHIGRQDLPFYHQRLAVVFEASGHADEETLAVHFDAGGSNEKAGHYYSLAGDRAATAVAFDRSSHLYHRAIELLSPAQIADRQLRAKYAEALANSGCGAEAAEAFLELAGNAEGEGEFEYRRKAAYYYCASGRVKEGRDAFRQILARVGLRMPASQAGALLAVILEQFRLRLRGLGFKERPEAEIPRRVLQRLDAAWAAGASVSTVDTLSGLSILVRFLRMALDAGETYRIVRAIGFQAAGLATTDPSGRGRAREMLRIMEGLVSPASRPEARAALRMTAAMVAYGHSRWKQALDDFAQSEAILSRECTGVAWELATCRMFTLWTLHNLGEFGQMGRSSSRWITVARERGDLFTETNIGVYGEPLALLAGGQPEAARASVKSALAKWPSDRYYLQNYLATLVSGAIELYAGNARAAWELIRAHWPRMARSLVLRADNSRIYARDLRIQSALAMAAEAPRPGPLIRFAESQTARQEREGLPHGPAFALNCRAGIAALRGDHGQAVGCLRASIRAFEALDMLAVAAMARRRLGELTGGEEGTNLLAEADAFFQRVDVVSPAQWARLHLNGFSKARETRSA